MPKPTPLTDAFIKAGFTTGWLVPPPEDRLNKGVFWSVTLTAVFWLSVAGVIALALSE
jgi:hypothetical protein